MHWYTLNLTSASKSICDYLSNQVYQRNSNCKNNRFLYTQRENFPNLKLYVFEGVVSKLRFFAKKLKVYH